MLVGLGLQFGEDAVRDAHFAPAVRWL